MRGQLRLRKQQQRAADEAEVRELLAPPGLKSRSASDAGGKEKLFRVLLGFRV